jgi:hypothetical protein
MPGVYKKKNCPHCNREHRGRGLFCSIPCSNAHREVKPETRAKISDIQKEYSAMTSARVKREAEEDRKRRRGEYVLQEDDWYIIPKLYENEDDGLEL